LALERYYVNGFSDEREPVHQLIAGTPTAEILSELNHSLYCGFPNESLIERTLCA
jgi:hypothetical protein